MGRVVSRDELLRLAAADRAAGRTIAFANGCFDLLHVGHVRYLQAAAREADRLVVAINDDASVRGLKGARPADPRRGGPRRAGRRAARRRLRRHLPGADRDAAAARAEARRPLQGDRLHRRHRARARDRARLRRPHRHRRRSEGSLHARSARADRGRTRNEHPDRPARRARRRRPRRAGRGGAAARLPERAHRLAGRREASRRSSIS